MSLIHRIEKWAHRKREKQLLERYGGIQWCPWCRQCAQSGAGEWGFRAWQAEPSLDVLTCSVCSGTSVWLWGMGMHYMGALNPPDPAHPEQSAFAAIRDRAITATAPLAKDPTP